MKTAVDVQGRRRERKEERGGKTGFGVYIHGLSPTEKTSRTVETPRENVDGVTHDSSNFSCGLCCAGGYRCLAIGVLWICTSSTCCASPRRVHGRRERP